MPYRMCCILSHEATSLSHLPSLAIDLCSAAQVTRLSRHPQASMGQNRSLPVGSPPVCNKLPCDPRPEVLWLIFASARKSFFIIFILCNQVHKQSDFSLKAALCNLQLKLQNPAPKTCQTHNKVIATLLIIDNLLISRTEEEIYFQRHTVKFKTRSNYIR